MLPKAISLLVAGCDDKSYGYGCLYNCSGHCLNDSPCNKQTGHCDGGCNPGYTNKDCNESKITDQCIFDANKLIILLFSIIMYMHLQSIN